MLLIYSAAYLVVATVVVALARLGGQVAVSPAALCGLVVGGWALLAALWWAGLRLVDPYADGALGRGAGALDRLVQYGVFPAIERSSLVVVLLILAVCLLGGWGDGLLCAAAVIGLVSLGLASCRPREKLPAPPLPEPLPEPTAPQPHPAPEPEPLPQPGPPPEPGPLPPAPQPLPTPQPLPQPRTLPRTFCCAFVRDPVYRRTERLDVACDLHLDEWEARHAEARLSGTLDAIRQWGVRYARGGIGPTVRSLAQDLRRLSTAEHLTPLQEASLALSFAQSAITYATDLASTGVGDYPKYPVESLYDESGDCEDKSILAAAVLTYLGYEVCLFLLPEHVALGVAFSEPLPGAASFSRGGLTYCFCEATAAGTWIGEVGPRDTVEEIIVV